MILCIETSTDICSVAIVHDGKVIASVESEKSFSHSALLTRYIESVCKQAQISNMNELRAIALSEGPGSYTALRIGASVAKGICYACDLPLIAVNSLEALASGLYHTGIVDHNDVIIPVIDARRLEVYMAVYDGRMQVIEHTHTRILDEESLMYLSEFSTLHIVGDAVPKMKELLQARNIVYSRLSPSAKHMAQVVEKRWHSKDFVDKVYFEPNYFKSPNITVSKKKLL